MHEVCTSSGCGTDRSLASVQVEAVVRRVMWLIKDSQTKVLVFSTWAEVLQLLEHALKTNHVPCMRAKSRDALEGAIKEFRKPVQKGKLPLQTLLLLLKQGGNGLNLTGTPLSMHAAFLVPMHGPGTYLACIPPRVVTGSRELWQCCIIHWLRVPKPFRLHAAIVLSLGPVLVDVIFPRDSSCCKPDRRAL